MYLRLLDLLRCPSCRGRFEVFAMAKSSDGEITEGILHCALIHRFPIVRGVPRLLADAMARHAEDLAPFAPTLPPETLPLLDLGPSSNGSYDHRTQDNFSHEWGHHDLGGRTWTMDLDSRVQAFFLDPMRIRESELDGKLVLDAGCGNGSQSVAYTRYGCEVVALDLSSGLEHGQAFRRQLDGAAAEKVHFVQTDLRQPPFEPRVFDIIHSAGVLHHTPDTRRTFDGLAPLLKCDGTFYVWLYKYEAVVTPIVNALRAVTTSIPARVFAGLARRMAPAFQVFCAATNALGVRAYAPLSRREAALALMDIFGAPYAHYHSFDEVAGWYRAQGISEPWLCNVGRRGFGVCGRRDRLPLDRGN